MNTYIVRPRAMGKTTEIIKEVLAHDRILWVHSEKEKRKIEKTYPKMKHRVLTCRNFMVE